MKKPFKKLALGIILGGSVLALSACGGSPKEQFVTSFLDVESPDQYESNSTAKLNVDLDNLDKRAQQGIDILNNAKVSTHAFIDQKAKKSQTDLTLGSKLGPLSFKTSLPVLMDQKKHKLYISTDDIGRNFGTIMDVPRKFASKLIEVDIKKPSVDGIDPAIITYLRSESFKKYVGKEVGKMIVKKKAPAFKEQDNGDITVSLSEKELQNLALNVIDDVAEKSNDSFNKQQVKEKLNKLLKEDVDLKTFTITANKKDGDIVGHTFNAVLVPPKDNRNVDPKTNIHFTYAVTYNEDGFPAKKNTKVSYYASSDGEEGTVSLNMVTKNKNFNKKPKFSLDPTKRKDDILKPEDLLDLLQYLNVSELDKWAKKLGVKKTGGISIKDGSEKKPITVDQATAAVPTTTEELEAHRNPYKIVEFKDQPIRRVTAPNGEEKVLNFGDSVVNIATGEKMDAYTEEDDDALYEFVTTKVDPNQTYLTWEESSNTQKAGAKQIAVMDTVFRKFNEAISSENYTSEKFQQSYNFLKAAVDPKNVLPSPQNATDQTILKWYEANQEYWRTILANDPTKDAVGFKKAVQEANQQANHFYFLMNVLFSTNAEERLNKEIKSKM